MIIGSVVAEGTARVVAVAVAACICSSGSKVGISVDDNFGGKIGDRRDRRELN